MSKYGAKPTTVDGIRFDSGKEAKRYSELKLLERAGEISGLHCHPKFRITIDQVDGGEKHICDVVLDFAYRDYRGEPRYSRALLIYEDVKGKDNALSRLKRKLVEAQYGIKVRLT